MAIVIPDKIWIDQADLDALPTGSNPGWLAVKAMADADMETVGLNPTHYDSAHIAPRNTGVDHGNYLEDAIGGSHVMAYAIAWQKTGDTTYRDKAVAALEEVILSEVTSSVITTYHVSRRTSAFIVAASILGLSQVNAALHRKFIGWLNYFKSELVNEVFTYGGGVIETRSVEDMVWERPNNHGLSGEQSLIAACMYTKDYKMLEHSAVRHRSWCGETQEYLNFRYKNLVAGGWQPDLANPVGILPLGAVLNDGQDRNMSGCPPEEARRYAATFSWPVGSTNYYWTLHQWYAAIVHMLGRCGYPALAWGDYAFARFLNWVYTTVWVTNGVRGTINETPIEPFSASPAKPYFPGSCEVDALDNDLDSIYLANKVLSGEPTLATTYSQGKVGGYYPTVWPAGTYGTLGKGPSWNCYLFQGYTGGES